MPRITLQEQKELWIDLQILTQSSRYLSGFLSLYWKAPTAEDQTVVLLRQILRKLGYKIITIDDTLEDNTCKILHRHIHTNVPESYGNLMGEFYNEWAQVTYTESWVEQEDSDDSESEGNPENCVQNSQTISR